MTRTLLWAVLALAAAAQDLAPLFADEKDLDDECGAEGDQEACALSAIQKRSAVFEEPASLDFADEQLTNKTSEEDEVPGPADPALVRYQPEELGASPDEEPVLGSAPLRHYAWNCWHACGRKSGSCPGFCGEGNACCRWHVGGPPECHQVKYWPVIHMHTCVKTRHSSPSLVPGAPSAPVTGGTMTLYHMTSPESAKDILNSNFRVGGGGWCGAVIYLVNQPYLPKTKWNPQTTHGGAWIQLTVNTGKMCDMHRTCNDGQSGGCCTGADGGKGAMGAAKAGCNSIKWNPGDGDEYIIWNSAQIVSKKLYKCDAPDYKSVFR